MGDYITIKKEKTYMDLIDLLKKLKCKQDFECGESQNENQIQNLENMLKLKFPESYKQFLRTFGFVSFFGGHIYGPSKNSYYDLVTRNREAREEILPEDFQSLPEDALIISYYPGGGYYVLFSEDSIRKGQVGLFIDEMLYSEVQTWDSFEDFLMDGYCSDKYL